MRIRIDQSPPVSLAPPRGEVEMVIDAQHFQRVVLQGILTAKASLDIATADFKGMLVPQKSGVTAVGMAGLAGKGRRGRDEAPSIVRVLADLAQRGVEIRLLHSGVPSGAALHELRGGEIPANLTIRRCPRLHAKIVVVDCRAMYLGSANLTGAGLGAKGPHKRNMEMGIWTEASPLIDAALQQFNVLWEGERCNGCLRKDVCPVPLEEPDL